MKRIRPLMIYVGSLAVGLTAATQWTAAHLPGRDLGRHLTVLGRAIFAPWSVVVWQHRFGAVAPKVFRDAWSIVMVHVATGAILVLIVSGRTPTVRPMGADRWATLRDMKRAGLLKGGGTVVGRYRGRLLTYGGPEHQLVVGASRSGKGVGHVIPSLLSWPGSAIVYDIKAELWQATAGFRSTFSHCLFFNPTRMDSARWNPLLEIRKGDREIADAQNVAESITNPTGEKNSLDVWDQHAAQLLVATELHVLYTYPDEFKHLGTVRNCILDWQRTCRAMIETPHRFNPDTGVPEPHPEVARVASELMRQAPKFAAGVRATAAGYLALFADPVVCRNVAVSDYMLGDLVCSQRPVTLYIQTPPSDIPRLRPLTRLIWSQACRAQLEHLNTDNRGRLKLHPFLCEMDEFATLGKLEFFSVNLRQMAGYGMKCHIIVQSFNDIIEKYGPHQSILDNCHVITVFGCADAVTEQRVSQMCGTALEYRESYGHHRWPRLFPDSIQKSEQLRPLLQPGDVRTLPNDEQLIFITGHPPMRTKKVRYFSDREFKRRLLPPPDQSNGIDSPRKHEAHRVFGIPHDWTNERAKGPQMVMDEIFEPMLDEEWMPADGILPSERPEPSTRDLKDDYAL